MKYYLLFDKGQELYGIFTDKELAEQAISKCNNLEDPIIEEYKEDSFALSDIVDIKNIKLNTIL